MAPTPVLSRRSPVLRILTANLYNGRARPAALAAVLDATDPDVVAAQELAPGSAEVLAERFPHGLIHPSLDHTGIALAASSPIAVTRRHLPHRDGMQGLLDLAGGRVLELWSVHLANPVDSPPPIRARRAQVRALERAVAGTGPLVVVGDFNATPIWPAYRRLTRGLTDGVAEWADASGRRPAPTWGYRAWLPAVLRIDHALMRGMRVAHASTVRVAGSDHRALVVDVEPERSDPGDAKL
jgi:endonuclease/exonuclease/phosphatase (EEP) superfamily protein YafD